MNILSRDILKAPAMRRKFCGFVLGLVLVVIAPLGQEQFPVPVHATASHIGAKHYLLVLGASIPWGWSPTYQTVLWHDPDSPSPIYDATGFNHPSPLAFPQLLANQFGEEVINMSCPGESSYRFIHGDCPGRLSSDIERDSASQLKSALTFLHKHPGQVSPIILEFGGNDLYGEKAIGVYIQKKMCVIDDAGFHQRLQYLDENLTQTILPKLHAALFLNKQYTGDVILLNRYNAFQRMCPQTIPYQQEMNHHFAEDAAMFHDPLANVFDAFGGDQQQYLCTYTWMCPPYSTVSQAKEMRIGCSSNSSRTPCHCNGYPYGSRILVPVRRTSRL